MSSRRSVATATLLSVAPLVTSLAPVGVAQCETEEIRKIVANDAATGDQYGAAVAVGRNYLVSGAPLESDGGGDAGAVYIRDLVSNSEDKWTGFPGDLLGAAVDLSFPYAAVGAPSPGKKGFVGILERQGASWNWVSSWTPSTPGVTVGDLHGADVAIDGPRVAGGTPSYDGVLLDGGMVEIREEIGGAWKYTQTLSPPDLAPGDLFGSAVAMRGGVLAVGSPFHEAGPDANAGAVYVYRHSGVAFLLEQKLTAPDPRPNAWFGSMVDTDGQKLLVGAPGHDLAGGGSGNAYVYHWNGAAWVLDQNLKPKALVAADNFGMSGQVAGDIAVVGAAFADPNGIGAAGTGHLFREVGGQWVEQTRLVASDPQVAARLGESAATDGAMVVLGALFADDNGLADTGAVYRYDITDLSLTATPDQAVLGDSVRLSVCGGPPGNPVLLYVVSVNGVPLVQKLAGGVFGPGGSWTLAGKYDDPAFAGLTLEFLAIGIGAGGDAVQSNTEKLELL